MASGLLFSLKLRIIASEKQEQLTLTDKNALLPNGIFNKES